MKRKDGSLFHGHDLFSFTLIDLQFGALAHGAFTDTKLVFVNMGIGRMKIGVGFFRLRDISQNLSFPFFRLVTGQDAIIDRRHRPFGIFPAGDNLYTAIGTAIGMGIQHASVGCRLFTGNDNRTGIAGLHKGGYGKHHCN